MPVNTPTFWSCHGDHVIICKIPKLAGEFWFVIRYGYIAAMKSTARITWCSMSLSPESPYYLEAARRSISSNSSSTAPPNSFLTVEEVYDYKKYDVSIIDSKPLPILPSSISDESNPYSIDYPGSFMISSWTHCSNAYSGLHYSVSSLWISDPLIDDYIPACLCAWPRQYTPYNGNRYRAMCRNTYSTWSSHRSPSLATCGSFGASSERKTRMVGQLYR